MVLLDREVGFLPCKLSSISVFFPVSISFSNYRTTHPYHDDDDDSTESDEPQEQNDKGK
jgi:hypothetical protein